MKYLFILLAVILTGSCQTTGPKKKLGQPAAAGPGGYTMKFSMDPAIPVAGRAVQFTLQPVRSGTDSVVSLDIQHEKKIHLIVVTEDLSSFRHQHPSEQANGTYSLTDTFPHGGTYLLYADYSPAGAEKQVTLQTLKVTGNEVKPVVYTSPVTQYRGNGFSVTLKTAGNHFTSGKELVLTAEISTSAGQVTPDQLDNYLGEKAHMVIIGLSGKKYLHVHPMVMGKELMLHTTFTEPGLYRAWLEFKKDGKVQVADFVIKAE